MTDSANTASTDQPATYCVSTTFTDPNGAHAELESHRTKAETNFGGHVNFVNSNSSSVPTHDNQGQHTGFTTVLTSVWKKAPPEPVIETVDPAAATTEQPQS